MKAIFILSLLCISIWKTNAQSFILKNQNNTSNYKPLKIDVSEFASESSNNQYHFEITNWLDSTPVDKSVAKTSPVKIVSKTLKGDDKSKNDKEYYNRLMFLNAVSFEFSKAEKPASYVGHLNILAPNFIGLGKLGKAGINAGIMRINYLQNDSTTKPNNILIENVLISPLDSFKLGTKFNRQFNKYTHKVNNTNWSIYFQFLKRLCATSNDKFQLHAHLHAELLVSKWHIVTSVETQESRLDSITPSFINTNPVLRTALDKTFDNYYTNLSGYFGGGLTILANPWEKGIFCIQGTMGITTDNYILQSINPAAGRVSNSIVSSSKGQIYAGTNGNNNSKFYLIRSYYSHDINASKKGDEEDNTTSKLYIGVDIRGFLPAYAPKYALFAGLNINIEKVVDIFK